MSTRPLTIEDTLKTTRSADGSAEAMVSAALDYISQADGRFKAFVHLDRDRALEEAKIGRAHV